MVSTKCIYWLRDPLSKVFTSLSIRVHLHGILGSFILENSGAARARETLSHRSTGISLMKPCLSCRLRWVLTLLALCLLVEASQLDSQGNAPKGSTGASDGYASLGGPSSDDETYYPPTSSNTRSTLVERAPTRMEASAKRSSSSSVAVNGGETLYDVDLSPEIEHERTGLTHQPSYGTYPAVKRQLSHDECCRCWPF